MRDASCAYPESRIPYPASRDSHPASRIPHPVSSCNHQRHSLDRPERSERAHGISGKCLHPTWPAKFQQSEGTLQRQNESDETELPEFDTNIEADQRQRQLASRQAGARQYAGETEAVQQPEGKRHYPRITNGQARDTRCGMRVTGCGIGDAGSRIVRIPYLASRISHHSASQSPVREKECSRQSRH